MLCGLSREEEVQLCMNSIERVINTSMAIVRQHQREHGDAVQNLMDWEDLKPLVSKVWNDARNSVHVRYKNKRVNDF